MENLPDDTLTEILFQLDPDSREFFCGSSRRIKDICYRRVYPKLTEKARLPYNETDPYKKYLITTAIYGSSIKSASLVHPDYACIQAVKFDNEEVFRKYYPFTTNKGRKFILMTAGRFGRVKYFENGRLTNDVLPYWFSQTVSDPEAFMESLRSARLFKFDIITLEVYNQTLRNNIIEYGTAYFGERLIQQLRDNTFDASRTIDPEYPYKSVKNTTVAIMAWNLWHLPIENIDDNILQQGEETIGHLSALSLPIIYLQKPPVFFKNIVLNGKGYLPFLRFVNKFDLPPKYGTINNEVELRTALNNPLLIQAANSSKPILGSYINIDSVFRPYYENELVRPPNYYISNSGFGVLIQQAALEKLSASKVFIYGENVYNDDTPLGLYKQGQPSIHVYSQALNYDNYIAAEQNLEMNNGTEPELIPEILRRAGPILLPPYNSEKLPTFERVGFTNNLTKAAREMFVMRRYTTLPVSKKYQVNDNDLKTLVAKSYIQSGDYNRAFKVGLPQPSMLIHQIAISFQSIKKSELEQLFSILPQSDIEKLIPAALSLNMIKSSNSLGLLHDQLRRSKKKYQVNTDYLIKYYDCICLYGLSFMTRSCDLKSLRASLLEVIDSPRVPSRIKVVATNYL